MPSGVNCICTHCGRTIGVPTGVAPGRSSRCPHCQQTFVAPTEETATRTLEQSAAATSTAPETSAPKADASQATLTLAPQRVDAVSAVLPVAALAPRKIGRFEIRRTLGEGGFGIVYEAHDPQLDRAIALKVAKLGGDSEQRIKRFLREAKSAANLRHPNIVPLYEFGQDGDQFYLALAYVPGQSLDHVISELNARKEKMALRQAATLMRHLAEALAYAHGLGIVHRDIKPHNVMLDERGDPLLMDFGLAAREEDEKLTREGAVMGTAAYLAPEQYRGEPTAASDQYSLGATLYELLTGETPFAGPPDVQIYNHIHTEPESPRKRNPAVSRDLETICLKCLEKDASKRYADCRVLAEDLRRFLEGEPIAARPIGMLEFAWRWTKRHPAWSSSLAVASLLLAITTMVGLAIRKEVNDRENANHASALVDRVFDANLLQLPGVIKELDAYRVWTDPLLRKAKDESTNDPRKQLHASLALLPVDEEQVEYLFQRMLRGDPLEVMVIRDGLSGRKQDLVERLWTHVENQRNDNSERLRAACALSTLSPDDPRWAKNSDDLAATLVSQEPVMLGQWTETLKGSARWLLEPLSRFLVDENRSIAERGIISTVFGAFAASLPDGYALVESQLAQRPGADASESARVSLARKQASIGTVLLAIGRTEKAWALFAHQPDPTVRSYLINRVAPSGVDARVLMSGLDHVKEVSVRRAILSSLGEYGLERFTMADRRRFLPRLLQLYRDDPDPGIHGAAEWLLRHWQMDEQVRQIDEKLATGKAEGNRQWFVNRQGQTMVILAEPGTFWFGHEEQRHPRKISRTFALASKEVTVDQFLRHWPGYPFVEKRISQTGDSAMGNVTWYQAAGYCNWLSEHEGIPKDQWCYEPNKAGKYDVGMTMASNYLQRTGYRLPTEAEWEYACRAKAETAYSFGESADMLGKYSWYLGNALNRLQCVGKLRPNDFGFFDMLGNATEWSQSYYKSIPKGSTVFEDREELIANENDKVPRAVRGGSYLHEADDCRSDTIATTFASGRGYHIGFRPARTLRHGFSAENSSSNY